jgi:hypothetical protein
VCGGGMYHTGCVCVCLGGGEGSSLVASAAGQGLLGLLVVPLYRGCCLLEYCLSAGL